MSRLPLGAEKEVTVCDLCGDRLVLPPGIYYRDMKLHKWCAFYRHQQDLGDEVVAPVMDAIEEEIETLFENMEPMESPNWPY